jgi:hypothetical protein
MPNMIPPHMMMQPPLGGFPPHMPPHMPPHVPPHLVPHMPVISHHIVAQSQIPPQEPQQKEKTEEEKKEEQEEREKQREEELVRERLIKEQHKQDEAEGRFGHLPSEERINIFKGLLDDVVTEMFSDYRKNVPSLVLDVRYKALTSEMERKATFENWMRLKVTAMKKSSMSEKKQQKKHIEGAFKQMIDDLGDQFSHKTTFEELKQLCKEDERFNAVESKSDKLLLLNEKILPLRQAHILKKETAEQEFRDILRSLNLDFKTARWSQVKQEDALSETKYKSEMLNSKERESLFDALMKVLKKEAEKGVTKEAREELGKRDREREVLAQREREGKDRDRERERMQFQSESTGFAALIAEHFFDHNPKNINWKEMQKKYKIDSRGKTTLLSAYDKDKIIFDRLNTLLLHQEKEFVNLLKDISFIDVDTEWGDVIVALPQNNSVLNSLSDKQLRVVFEHYIANIRADAERNFNEMLSKFDKIKKDVQIGSKEYETIKILLADDPNWLKFASVPDRRELMLQQHILSLSQAGKKKPTGQTWVVDLSGARAPVEKKEVVNELPLNAYKFSDIFASLSPSDMQHQQQQLSYQLSNNNMRRDDRDDRRDERRDDRNKRDRDERSDRDKRDRDDRRGDERRDGRDKRDDRDRDRERRSDDRREDRDKRDRDGRYKRDDRDRDRRDERRDDRDHGRERDDRRDDRDDRRK